MRLLVLEDLKWTEVVEGLERKSLVGGRSGRKRESSDRNPSIVKPRNLRNVE